jgi:hypothetical protein
LRSTATGSLVGLTLSADRGPRSGHVAYLAQVDDHDYEAMGAVGVSGDPVGPARHVRVDDPQEADVTVAVGRCLTAARHRDRAPDRLGVSPRLREILRHAAVRLLSLAQRNAAQQRAT